MIRKEFPHFFLDAEEFKDRSRGTLKDAVKIKYELVDKYGGKYQDYMIPNKKMSVFHTFLYEKFNGANSDVREEWKLEQKVKKKLPNLLKCKSIMDEDENMSYFLYFEKETTIEENIQNLVGILTNELYS